MRHKWQGERERGEKVRAQTRDRRKIIIIISLITAEKTCLENWVSGGWISKWFLSPRAPGSSPSSHVGDEVILYSSSQWWEASFSTPQPRSIWDACLWCARNMKDAGLSASCQPSNYPASFPGASSRTEPGWAGQRSAALLLMDLINSPERWFVFLQLSQWLHSAGWGHQRPGNKGAALHSKDSTPVCSSPKRPFRRKRIKKEENIQVSLAPEQQVLEQKAGGAYFLSLLPFLFFPVSHCGTHNNWQANELLAHTVATARTMSLIGGGAIKCDFAFKRVDIHTRKWIS